MAITVLSTDFYLQRYSTILADIDESVFKMIQSKSVNPSFRWYKIIGAKKTYKWFSDSFCRVLKQIFDEYDEEKIFTKKSDTVPEY